MKVERFGGDKSYYAERRRVLAELVEAHRQGGGRPCPGCDVRCPSCGSLSCRCNCSPDCPQAPETLSSVPDRFPIEQGIVPLVYSIYESDIGLPCWSCEGHPDGEGETGKLPQVWFYVRHQVLPDLLARYLWQLKFRNLVRHKWKIAVVSTDNTVDTTFSIVPDTADGNPSLENLRKDIKVIGENMSAELVKLARESLEEIDQHLGREPVAVE